MAISDEDLKKRFEHHPPVGDRADRHNEVRQYLVYTARHIVRLTPEGREQSLAITHLEEAMMWANAAIARESS